MGAIAELDKRLDRNLQKTVEADDAYREMAHAAARDDELPDDFDGVLSAAGKTMDDLKTDIARTRPIFIYLKSESPEVDAIPPDPPVWEAGQRAVTELRQRIDQAKTRRWRDAEGEYNGLHHRRSELEEIAGGKKLDVERDRRVLLRLGYSKTELGRTFGSGPEHRNFRSVTLDKATCEAAIRQREYQIQKTPDAAFLDRVRSELDEWRSLLSAIETAEAALAEVWDQLAGPERVMAEEKVKIEARKIDPYYLARLALAEN